MKHSRHGFTLIELVVVILIGSILTSIAFSSFTSVLGSFSVRGARDTFASMHARARTQAIELGTTIHLLIDATGDSVVVRNRSTILEVVDYDTEMDVDVVASSDSLRLCMNSRGYADDECNNFSSAATVYFVLGTDTAQVVILPLGQLIY